MAINFHGSYCVLVALRYVHRWIKMTVFYDTFFRKNKPRNTIYESFKPILILSALGGVCNLKKHAGRYIVSFWLTVFHVVVILANIIHLITIPRVIIYTEKIKQDFLNNNTHTIYNLHMSDYVTRIANPALISASTLVLRITNLIVLHKRLPNIFSNIDHEEKVIGFKNVKYGDNVHVKMRTCWILLLSLPFQIYAVSVMEYYPLMAIFAINNYNNFSVVCLESQYSYISYVLKKRFRVLNEHLKQINKTKEDLNCLIGLKRRELILNLSNHLLTKTTLEILKIRDCHRMLCKCCTDLNKLYSVQLLVALTSCGVNALLNFYFAIYGGYDNITSQNYSTKNSIEQGIWGLYYFIRFANLCVVSENLCQEADLTKILVCDLLRDCTDKNLKSELWVFHSYATSNVIKFIASGFFTVNLGLISSALSVGTTYLVILAQFRGDNK